MKKMILAFSLLTTGLAFAETNAFISLSNFGSSVQLRVYNNSQVNVTCSGPVYMTTNSNRMYTEYYFESIPANFTSHRTFFSRDFRDPIRFAHHSVFCR